VLDILGFKLPLKLLEVLAKLSVIGNYNRLPCLVVFGCMNLFDVFEGRNYLRKRLVFLNLHLG
jgi:hypothetical protein